MNQIIYSFEIGPRISKLHFWKYQYDEQTRISQLISKPTLWNHLKPKRDQIKKNKIRNLKLDWSFYIKLTRSNIKNPLIVCWWGQLRPKHSIFVAIFQISMNFNVVVRPQTNQWCIQLIIATFCQRLVRDVTKAKWRQIWLMGSIEVKY